MANRSRYAEKRDSGQMMYGPGCCAHTITDSQIAKAKADAEKRGHFRARPVFFEPDPIMTRMRRTWVSA